MGQHAVLSDIHGMALLSRRDGFLDLGGRGTITNLVSFIASFVTGKGHGRNCHTTSASSKSNGTGLHV